MFVRSLVGMAALGLVLVGCSQAPTPPQSTSQKSGTQAEAAKTSPDKPKIPELTQEDLDLIASDPADLTIDQRRKRGQALRRKIMQNPDSPAAKSLREVAEAIERGEVTPPGKKEGLYFSLPNRTAKSVSPSDKEPSSDAPPSDDPHPATPAQPVASESLRK